MTFHVVTLFPEMVEQYVRESILGRALSDKKISVQYYNPRDFSIDARKRVDDIPYGGGPGMVMQADPILRAVAKARGRSKKKKFKIFIFSPSGEKFTNIHADTYILKYTDIILICGRYEGIDARVREILQADELSIGDYVLTGGEIPAMVIIDAVSRRIPGVLGDDLSVENRRIASHDVYTRPAKFLYAEKEYSVPEVLLSGDHKKIDAWRKDHS